MSRWRPPQPRSSPFITAAGLRRLKDELQQLWVDRRDVVAALSAAAAEGDRSENAEYQYRKKQLGEMDRRIRYLNRRIGEVTPVGGRPDSDSRVYFSAWVTVEDAEGCQLRYRIVGADEIDPDRNWVSVDSPLACALLGRGIDDEVEVSTPAGTRRLVVCDIDYDSPDSGQS